MSDWNELGKSEKNLVLVMLLIASILLGLSFVWFLLGESFYLGQIAIQLGFCICVWLYGKTERTATALLILFCLVITAIIGLGIDSLFSTHVQVFHSIYAIMSMGGIWFVFKQIHPSFLSRASTPEKAKETLKMELSDDGELPHNADDYFYDDKDYLNE